MLKNRYVNLQQLAVPSISLIILTYLGLQAGVTFGIFCPRFCPPWLWPFLTYPMYRNPHYEGEKFDRYFVFGTLENATEVPILPEDVGTDFWVFEKSFITPLLKDDRQNIKKFVELYQSRHKRKLVSLRLETHPLLISKQGGIASPTQVIKTIQLKAL